MSDYDPKSLSALVTRCWQHGVAWEVTLLLAREHNSHTKAPLDEFALIRLVRRTYGTWTSLHETGRVGIASRRDPAMAISGDATALAPTRNVSDLSARAIEFFPLLGNLGYLVRGWSHLIAGYPRSGKTKLVVQACAGIAAHGHGVLYFTEESEQLWRERVAYIDITSPNLNIAFALEVDPAAIFVQAFSSPQEVIVIDTLRNILRLTSETDSGAVARAVSPWIKAARATGKTLIVVHHSRKTDGKTNLHGEAIAGGHGLMALFDIALEITRLDNDETKRLLRIYSRILSTPPLLYSQVDDVLVSELAE